jgi:hypothetical protein
MSAYGFHWSCYNEIAMKPKISRVYSVIFKITESINSITHLIYFSEYISKNNFPYTALHLHIAIQPRLIRVAVMSVMYITGSLKSSVMLIVLMASYTYITKNDRSQLVTFCN